MKCEICGKDVSNIKSHIRHRHSDIDAAQYIICKICNRQISQKGLKYHITHSHNITDKEYYDKYIRKENEGYCKICQQESEFISLSFGYRDTCIKHTIRPKDFECKICGKIMKNPGPHLQKHNISQKDYYDKYCKQENDGFCLVCGKPTRFISVTKGYAKHCSDSCAIKDQEIQEKIKQTTKEHYGVEYNLQRKEIIEKAQSPEAKAKKLKSYKQTCIERYGVDNTQKVPEIRKKVIKTNKELYGGCGYQSSKTKETMLDKYGAENIFMTEYGKQKVKETNLDVYGGMGYQSSKILEKIKQTSIERYGVDNIGKLQETHIKSWKTRRNNEQIDQRLDENNL